MRKRAKRDKDELIRRLRLGHISKFLHWRYGSVYPDDDAGREDLRELLLPISLGADCNRLMRKAIKMKAPWMPTEEVEQLMAEINLMPPYLRKPKAREVGERLGVTNDLREVLKLWTIAPIDMTDEQMAEQRREKNRKRLQRRRQKAGARSHTSSIAKIRPWDLRGISRRKYYRDQAQERGTGCGTKTTEVNLTGLGTKQCHLENGSKEGLAMGIGRVPEGERPERVQRGRRPSHR
jgi:hypothetical protein